MRTLFSFVGGHDPESASLPTGQPTDGPILSLVKHRHFDRIVLLVTPAMKDRAAETARRLRGRAPETDVALCDCTLRDPTDHIEILRFLRALMREHAVADDAYYVSVVSGTPQMHACWLLLAAAGETPITLLQVRAPRYVTPEQPLITALDPVHPELPRVLPQRIDRAIEDAPDPDLSALREAAGIVGESPALRKALNIAARAAVTDASVLILGESGTGKELVAQFIHACSKRSGQFVSVNCGGLPEHLIESELFGHRKGAFTGADKERKGLFAQAHGGTLFLDELGELPPPMQPKLLRALQEKKVRPVGADTETPVDARIVAATNVDIKQAIKEKRLREDLYYRVAGVSITLPPLRRRQRDIPALVAAVMANSNLARGKQFTAAALRKLQRHAWPGNVRELKQVVNNALIMSDGDVIDDRDIHLPGEEEADLGWLPEPYPGFNVKTFCEQINRHMKERALAICEGNLTEAAKLLGISPQAMSKEFRKDKKDQKQ